MGTGGSITRSKQERKYKEKGNKRGKRKNKGCDVRSVGNKMRILTCCVVCPCAGVHGRAQSGPSYYANIDKT